MIIYGLMLMGLCMFAGLIVGDLLGLLLGISANIGGVGFASLRPMKSCGGVSLFPRS